MNSLVSRLSPSQAGESSWSPSFSMSPNFETTFRPMLRVSSLASVPTFTAATVVMVS